MWWLVGEDMVANWWKYGGSLIEMWWVIGGDVVAHWQGWELAYLIFERIARFLSKNERFAHIAHFL